MRLLMVLAILTILLIAVSAFIWFLWTQVGFWAIPIVFVLLIAAAWGIKKALGSLLKKLFMAPFKMKGAALEGAAAEIHEAVRLSSEGDKQLVRVDATITPAPNPKTPFGAWEIGELRLVPFGTKPGPPPDDEDTGDIESIEVCHEGAFVKDGSRPGEGAPKEIAANGDDVEQDEDEENNDDGYVGGKVAGPHRIRLTARIPASMSRIAFRYYFEVFGDVPIR